MDAKQHVPGQRVKVEKEKGGKKGKERKKARAAENFPPKLGRSGRSSGRNRAQSDAEEKKFSPDLSIDAPIRDLSQSSKEFF